MSGGLYPGQQALGRELCRKRSALAAFHSCGESQRDSVGNTRLVPGKSPLLLKNGHSSLIINKPNTGILKQFVLGIGKEAVCVRARAFVCAFLISPPAHPTPTPGTPRLNKILLMYSGFNIASGSSRCHKIPS